MSIWTRLGRSGDLEHFLTTQDMAGVVVDQTELITGALARGECLLAGRGAAPEGFLIRSRSFFGRDFISLVAVSGGARRCGVATALMESAETACAGAQVFTSTNQSNLPMQALLAKRSYLAAGAVLHLDAGDPELIFVKYLSAPGTR